MLGGLKTHVGPTLAGVDALVDTVTVARAALAIVLSRPQPQDLGIPGVDGDTANRIGAVIVKDRRPRGAVVRRFPDIARGHRHIPCAEASGVLDDVTNTSGLKGRADVAERQAGKSPRVEPRRLVTRMQGR